MGNKTFYRNGLGMVGLVILMNISSRGMPCQKIIRGCINFWRNDFRGLAFCLRSAENAYFLNLI